MSVVYKEEDKENNVCTNCNGNHVSHCIDEDKGCLCDDCPIHAKYDLVREDYCLKTGGLVSRSCVAGFNRDKIN